MRSFANIALQAGILSLEEEIIDATTEEGKQHLEKLKEEAQYADDPE